MMRLMSSIGSALDSVTDSTGSPAKSIKPDSMDTELTRHSLKLQYIALSLAALGLEFVHVTFDIFLARSQ
jgi:hypothetical protein